MKKMEENGEKCFNDSPGYQDSLDAPPPPEEQDVYDFEESLVRRKRQIGVYWRKPVTVVYQDNFGFSVNGYQPMIDYLDAKDSGGGAHKSEVHLPYLEERCLNKYSSKKPFRYYDNSDIDKFIEKGEKIRTRIRQNDAAGASNVTRRTHTNWSMTKKYVQLVKNSYVVDFRKIHCDKDEEEEEEEELPNYVVPTNAVVSKKTLALLPKYFLSDMDAAASLGTYIRNKIDHDHEMAVRRDRLKALDDQYEHTLKKLADTVGRISQRSESIPQIISPQGHVYNPQDMLDVTEELVHRNRAKREQDLYRLDCNVNALTDVNAPYRYGPISSPYIGESDLGRINPTIIAIAKRNADAALMARSGPNRGVMRDDIDDADALRRRYLHKAPIESLDDLPPVPKVKKHREDLISDVQSRVVNRAREMGGVSAEALRISNRARFVNTVSPRPETGAVDMRVPPSKIERNIMNMARSFAYTGKPIRRYDVDEEVDEPVTTPSTNITKTYCTREYERPISQIPSDSNRARNAAIKARTRNTLLGN